MVRVSPKISRNRMTKNWKRISCTGELHRYHHPVIIIAMWLHSLQEAKHDIPITLACVWAGKTLEQGKDLTPLDEQRPPILTSFCKGLIRSHTSHTIFTSPSLIQIILAVPVLYLHMQVIPQVWLPRLAALGIQKHGIQYQVCKMCQGLLVVEKKHA